MPEIDFLNKKTFTKTSGMINLRKRATIESPSHAYILDPTVKLLVCHDAYLFYEKVKCIN